MSCILIYLERFKRILIILLRVFLGPKKYGIISDVDLLISLLLFEERHPK